MTEKIFLIVDKPFEGMAYGVCSSEEEVKKFIKDLVANGYSNDLIYSIPLTINQKIDYNSTMGKTYYLGDKIKK